MLLPFKSYPPRALFHDFGPAHIHIDREHTDRSAFPKRFYHAVAITAQAGDYLDDATGWDRDSLALAVDRVKSEGRPFQPKSFAAQHELLFLLEEKSYKLDPAGQAARL